MKIHTLIMSCLGIVAPVIMMASPIGNASISSQENEYSRQNSTVVATFDRTDAKPFDLSKFGSGCSIRESQDGILTISTTVVRLGDVSHDAWDRLYRNVADMNVSLPIGTLRFDGASDELKLVYYVDTRHSSGAEIATAAIRFREVAADWSHRYGQGARP